MWKEMKEAYGSSGRFALALPLIFAAPVVVEAIQHLIEWRIGMFTSFAAAKAVGSDPARLNFGYVKIATLFLVAYWVWRFLGFNDRARTLCFNPVALRLFALVMLYNVAMVVVQDLAGRGLGMAFEPGWALIVAGLAAMLGAMAVELLLAGWKVASALGDREMGVLASARLMRGNLGWSFAFSLGIFFPTMILHYALNFLAIGRGAAIAVPMLALDSLLVGYLAVILPAAVFIVARRAASRAEGKVLRPAGIPLTA